MSEKEDEDEDGNGDEGMGPGRKRGRGKTTEKEILQTTKRSVSWLAGWLSGCMSGPSWQFLPHVPHPDNSRLLVTIAQL